MDERLARNIYTRATTGDMVRRAGPCPQRDENERSKIMAGHGIPHFHNDAGHTVIEIGVKEFMCVGATPPFDHPHVYLDMGDDSEKVCPYCSTLYRHNPTLAAAESVPADCLFHVRAA
jgi:uncharacterized Zn-finger protein